MDPSENQNLRHSFSLNSKKPKPLIPIEMQQHILKQMRENKLDETKKQQSVPTFKKPDALQSVITPFIFEGTKEEFDKRPGIITPYLVEFIQPSKEPLTTPPPFPFDEHIQKVNESSEPVQDPFQRKVIYLTPDTLADAFELLNRVSAARHLFDANISAEIKEDQEKSLWYLEVVV